VLKALHMRGSRTCVCLMSSFEYEHYSGTLTTTYSKLDVTTGRIVPGGQDFSRNLLKYFYLRSASNDESLFRKLILMYPGSGENPIVGRLLPNSSHRYYSLSYANREKQTEGW